MCCSSDPIFGPQADPQKGNIICVYNKYDFKIDPQNGSTQTHVTPTICREQVRTSWQWHRAIQKNVKADGADILRINLDETSMPLNYDSQKGVVTTAFQKDVVLVDKQSATNRISNPCGDDLRRHSHPAIAASDDHWRRTSVAGARFTCFGKRGTQKRLACESKKQLDHCRGTCHIIAAITKGLDR